MFCSFCGSRIPDGSIFCQNCGKHVLPQQADMAGTLSANGRPCDAYAPPQGGTAGAADNAPPQGAAAPVRAGAPADVKEPPSSLQNHLRRHPQLCFSL